MTPAVRKTSQWLSSGGGTASSHLDLLVATTTGDLVGDKVDAVDLVSVAGQVDADLVRLEVPELQIRSCLVM